MTDSATLPWVKLPDPQSGNTRTAEGPVQEDASSAPTFFDSAHVKIKLFDSLKMSQCFFLEEDALRWRIISLVRENEGMRISEVAERLGLDLMHAVELVREMRARGYLAEA